MRGKLPFKAGSTEAELWAQIDHAALPQHIAIIMDGNGRWAQRRQQPRIAGHRAGVQAVREIVKCGARIGLPFLTLYAFSQDNWKRPADEVDFLMRLLRQYVRRDLDYMKRNNVRLQVIGRWQELPQKVQEDVTRAVQETAVNDGLQVVVALNYSGRGELLAAHLYTRDFPDPDLLIRTSGEMRVSNFLLWQIAYTEIWVTDTLWPDFSPEELLQAILDFQRRERRYGGLAGDAGRRRETQRNRPATGSREKRGGILTPG
jgi:undecaprenyl diphosphate synthase